MKEKKMERKLNYKVLFKSFFEQNESWVDLYQLLGNQYLIKEIVANKILRTEN